MGGSSSAPPGGAKQTRRIRKQKSSMGSSFTERSGRRSSVDERAWKELVDKEDVHMRLMRRYKEAPTSWYLTTFGVMLVVGIFVVE